MGQKEVASLAALGGISVAVASYYLATRRPTDPALPATMRRLVVTQPDTELENVKIVVEQMPVPNVGYGQVLVKMEAVPVVRRMRQCLKIDRFPAYAPLLTVDLSPILFDLVYGPFLPLLY